MPGPGSGKHTYFSDTIPDANAGGTSPDRINYLRRMYSSGPSMVKSDVISRVHKLLEEDLKSPNNDFGSDYVSFAGAPNLLEVKWNNPGDPATPFTPDTRAPALKVPVDQLGSTSTVRITTSFDPPEGEVKANDVIAQLMPSVSDVNKVPITSPHMTAPKVNDGTQIGKSNPVNYPEADITKGGMELYK